MMPTRQERLRSRLYLLKQLDVLVGEEGYGRGSSSEVGLVNRGSGSRNQMPRSFRKGFDAARLFSEVQRLPYSQGFATEGAERSIIHLFRDTVSAHSQGVI